MHYFYFFELSNSFSFLYKQLFSVTCALFCETDAWFWRRRKGNSKQCPRRGNIKNNGSTWNMTPQCISLKAIQRTSVKWWLKINRKDFTFTKRLPSFILLFFLSGGASPYYFGTTNLWCMKKGKRGAPSRNTWALSHRFIYYKGYYFEFLSKNLLIIMILPTMIFLFYWRS